MAQEAIFFLEARLVSRPLEKLVWLQGLVDCVSGYSLRTPENEKLLGLSSIKPGPKSVTDIPPSIWDHY